MEVVGHWEKKQESAGAGIRGSLAGAAIVMQHRNRSGVQKRRRGEFAGPPLGLTVKQSGAGGI